jgi:hypothetical protein
LIEFEANKATDMEINPDEAPEISEGGYQLYPGANLLEERDRRWRELTQELQDLDRKIKSGTGYDASTTTASLEENYFLFDANYLNLRHILEQFEQPTVFLKLFDERERGRLTLFVRDAIRLFHNYLAGAATLLDHTRVVNDELYQETSFAEEYSQQIDQRFKGSPLPHFIEDLRNHMIHKGLPFTLSELRFDRSSSGVEADSALSLDVGKLRSWENWSEKGREYLGALDDKAKLEDVVEEYTSVVAEFYRWFEKRHHEQNLEALRELEELQNTRGRLQGELRRLEDPLELTEKTVSGMREERRNLTDELENERRRSEQVEQKQRKLQVEVERLEAERSKGSWRRLFGR